MEYDVKKLKKILSLLNQLDKEDLRLLAKSIDKLLELRQETGFNVDADDDKGRWITTEKGHHVHIGKGGKPDIGNKHVIETMTSGGKKSSGTSPKKTKGEMPVVIHNKHGKDYVFKNGYEFNKWLNDNGIDDFKLSGEHDGTRYYTINQKPNPPKSGVKSAPDDGTGRNGGSGGSGGGGGGYLKPGSRSPGNHIVIDTRDALEQRDGKTGKLVPNSLREHCDENGNLSAKRQAHHDDIINRFFEGKKPVEKGKRKVTMLGGGPASGKSTTGEKQDESSYVEVNPDDVKMELDGYKKMAVETDDAANYFHEESSALAKSEYAEAMELGINVTYDGTGDGSPKSLRKKIKQARDAGYAVEGYYTTVSFENAIERNELRYQTGIEKFKSGKSEVPPRYVKPEKVIEIHKTVTDCAVECAADYDTFTLFDNNGTREQIHPIATGGGGKGIRVKGTPGTKEYERNKKELQDFLDKGYGKYTINKDGYVEVVESPYKK